MSWYQDMISAVQAEHCKDIQHEIKQQQLSNSYSSTSPLASTARQCGKLLVTVGTWLERFEDQRANTPPVLLKSTGKLHI